MGRHKARQQTKREQRASEQGSYSEPVGLSPAREQGPSTFRLLVEGEITVEEYVADLKRRVDEERKR
jgi:hypothetical protein